MITVYNNPFLLDFIKMAIKMPEDERKQIEAFTGQPYDVDGVAIGNFMVPGPKWVFKIDEEPICVGGFSPQRPGVWRDFMLTCPQAFESANARTVTRLCRRIMDSMFKSGAAHRLECIVPASRIALRPELERWYAVLGYNKEGLRYGYCANGDDAIAYARVKH
jgi:hypothetical protein